MYHQLGLEDQARWCQAVLDAAGKGVESSCAGSLEGERKVAATARSAGKKRKIVVDLVISSSDDE